MIFYRYMFILASASPRRRELLTLLGVKFRVVKTAIDEASLMNGNPAQAARRVAQEKARVASLKHPQAVILAADTIVVNSGKIWGKPKDQAEAFSMLVALRDRWHRVITVLALAVPGARVPTVQSVTRVRMRYYSVREINDYIRSKKAMDKAGAYGIQDKPFDPVAEFRSCRCNIIGFPLAAAAGLLSKAGVKVKPKIAEIKGVCEECFKKLRTYRG